MIIKDIYGIIPSAKRKGIAGVISGSVVLAILNLIGIAALISILLLVLDENAFISNRYVQYIYVKGGFRSYGMFVAAVCAAVVLISVIKNLLSVLISQRINRYLISLYGSFSYMVFDNHFSRGLLFIRQYNTSTIINNINTVCLKFTNGVIGSLLSIATETIITLAIVAALLIYDPKLVIVSLVVFSPAIAYVFFLRRRMANYGKQENKLYSEQNKTIYESVRGFTDIEINNAKPYAINKYRKVLDSLAKLRIRSMLASAFSRNTVELSLIIGVILIILTGLALGNTMPSLRLSLGIFAVAAYKIVPSVNRCVACWLEYKRNIFSFDTIRSCLHSDGATAEDVCIEKLPFERELVLEQVSFSYPDGKKIFNRLSITFRKGERTGIKGKSGAGKSTLMNLICGLLPPDSGRILADGTHITDHNRRMWQNNIGYVSQDVFIPDLTIAENVAFGAAREDIDDRRVWSALRAASLEDFVKGLPEGLNTLTGDSGCRISGGQRQRIAIARALYRNVSLLLFDEATSSLDKATETEIINAVSELSAEFSELTIFVISHSDRTLSFCDRIIDIDEITGKV